MVSFKVECNGMFVSQSCASGATVSWTKERTYGELMNLQQMEKVVSSIGKLALPGDSITVHAI